MLEELSEWGLWQRAAGLSERTIMERRATLEHMVKVTGCTLSGFTTRDIVAYLGRPKLAPSSKHSYYVSIRAYCTWAMLVGLREDDPSAKAPKPKRPKATPRPQSADDMRRILAVDMRAKTRMMVLLAAAQGLRVHEIAKVSGDDFQDGVMMVTGKGGKTAMLPVHEAVADLAGGFPRRGWWFPSPAHPDRPVQPAAVRAAIYRVMERAGVTGHPHRLRHWYGTTLLQKGVDLRTVQELMRHESVASTQIYTLVTDERRAAGLAKLTLPTAA